MSNYCSSYSWISKDENNNNNLENNETYIDENNELGKKDLKSIKEIAQSYCISTSQLNKQDIVKRKREYEEEQKQKENVNSFNKIIKLTITDNIEPTEKLFWKIFRNKTIYKNIFSFMDKQFSINYDSMSSIDNLIENNQINILKEKVYRKCRYLHISFDYEDGLKPTLLFVKLFSNIKNDDYKFYRNFFNGDNDYYNSYSTISAALILSKNLEMYKLYINEFNYKPTETDFLYSLLVGSNKFIEYLLELNSPNSSLFSLTNLFLKEYENLLYNLSKLNYPIEKLNIFKGLLCFLNIIGGDYDNQRYEKYVQQIDYIISTLSKRYSFSINSVLEFNERSTLKKLIIICKFILFLKKSIDNGISLITIKHDNLKIKKEKFIQSLKSIPTTTTITIQEIDNFIIDKIDKQTLKSKLEDPINYYNNSNKEVKCFIKKLLDLYQSVFNYIPMDLYLCYYEDDVLNNNYILGDKYLAAFKFGNFQLLLGENLNCNKLLPNNNGNFTFDPTLQENPDINKFIVLFSHCFDRDKKIKFIDQLIEINTRTKGYNIQNEFFYMLIMHGDIELLKYFSNKVGSTTSFYFNSNKEIIPPTYYIESIEMLEYLFNNHRDYLIDSHYIYPNGYSTFFKSLQLLQHFESLLIQYKLNNPSIIEKDPIRFIDKKFGYKFDLKRNKNYIDFIIHFATNSPYNCYYNICKCVRLISILTSGKSSINFEVIKKLFTLLQQFKNDKPNYRIKYVSPQPHSMRYLKFIHWVSINFSHELQLGGILYYGENHYHEYLFATNGYDFENNNNIKNNTINNYYHIENDINLDRLSSLTCLVELSTDNNFKLLNWFLTKIKNYYYSSNTTSIQKSKIRSILSKFMNKIIFTTKLKVLEHIHQNFDFIFKEESVGGIITIDTLEYYLKETIDRGSIKVTEFISQFISFPKFGLEIFSNEKLKLYFSNK
ncbi:hypothetical protein ACTFIZ_001913 [Dictyostelium cf. discoideum]